MRIRTFLLAALIMVLASCNHHEKEVVKARVSLSEDCMDLVLKNLSVNAKGISKTVSFTSTRDWTASISYANDSAGWVGITPDSGNAGKEVSFELEVFPNATLDDRYATVVIQAEEASVSFKVAQEGDRYLIFSDPIVEADCIGAFDRNNDGRLSYEEAELVTDVSGCFKNKSAYKHFDEFERFTGVKTLPKNLFKKANLLESITLPKNLTIIEEGAFSECAKLETVGPLPSTILRIDSYAFYGCSNLQDAIVLPSTLPTINSYCFKGCTKIKSVTIPQSVINLSPECFMNCETLTTITIPGEVINLIERPFMGCKGLISIDLSSSTIVNLGDAFSGCTSLRYVELPASLYSLYRSFENCTSLTDVTFPERVSSVGENTFAGCTSLEFVRFLRNGPISFNATAFKDCNCKIYLRKSQQEYYQNNYPDLLERIVWE